MRTVSLAIAVLVAACDAEPLTPPPAEVAKPEPPPPPPTPPKDPPIVVRAGLEKPESVVHDAEADVYLVSNIAGKPLEKNGKGFISRVAPDGKVLELKWIAKKLDAPKGMALSGGKLYVADIDVVRIFDSKTGKPAGRVKIKGATFLNDVAAAADGSVYVSDTGLMQWGPYMEAKGNDAIYRLDGKKAVTVIADKALGNPNGILVDGDSLWVVNKAGELSRLSADGKRTAAGTAPKGRLDGIVKTDAGLLISSWEAEAVYLRRADGSFETVAEKLKAPADIGHDAKRGRVLVPLLTRNELHIVPL